MDKATIDKVNTLSILLAGVSILLAVLASSEQSRSKQEVAVALKNK